MGKKQRNTYLTNISLEDAQDQYFSKIKELGLLEESEVLPVVESLNRVTVKPVFAEKSSPNYNAAAMDGIAVISDATYGATESEPVYLKLNEDFIYINTGGYIKDPYNSVIMIEDIVEIDETTVEIRQPAIPWQHIRPIGEDIVESELIIWANHKIRPMDIGALLSGQIVDVEVYKLPKVGIIPTGSEIVQVEDKLDTGKIIESNSNMFAAMVAEYNGIPNKYSVVPDDYNLLKNKVLEAVEENDIVVINAGSSAGSEDYTVDVLREIGDVFIHGIATKPGKPTILAIVNRKPVIGIPGYPVSAYFVFEFFVKPLLFQYNRQMLDEPRKIKSILSRTIVSSLQHEEFIRIKLGLVNNKIIATPLDRGAGVTMSLVRADGILVVPQNIEGYEAGKEVDVQLLKPAIQIENTIVSIGSHDLVMDMLSNELHLKRSDMFLSSAHVGSLGGIMAMKKGECHIAPIHLMDENTGDYNKSYIKKYLNDSDYAIIKFVKRSQGLMVQKGNPLNIQSIKDLAREDVQFVNRQRGAGTRILLDYHLNQNGVSSSSVQGYEREFTTHMAVAAAVAGGSADCGMGVMSAAKTMGLDFIPIAWEEYDLCISKEMLKDEKIISLIKVIQSKEFIDKIQALDGYNTDRIGEIEEV